MKAIFCGGNVEEAAYTEDGLHVNSDFLDGLNKEDAIAKIVAWLEEKGCGQEKVTYRLRDWLFSRLASMFALTSSRDGKVPIRTCLKRVSRANSTTITPIQTEGR